METLLIIQYFGLFITLVILFGAAVETLNGNPLTRTNAAFLTIVIAWMLAGVFLSVGQIRNPQSPLVTSAILAPYVILGLGTLGLMYRNRRER